LLSFIGALFSAASFYKYLTKGENKTWYQLGRTGFLIHGLATLLLIALIFYIMINAMYEYNYVHGHVSDDLPMRYIFSAFWEGQEGSFMLWMFWHVILGFVFLRKTDKWSASVVLGLALIQAFLASMLLGIHIPLFGEEYKIGSNPTVLLRDMIDAPIFSSADYLSLIEGTGLNPLLQNYWMTIHPPVLFLGFASTAIPFGFALGGLLTKDHKGWLRPALRWSLFSAFFLGTGILMGAAWAYEALGFGGYWAWDPVENASFVPWIILVAGIHTNVVALNTGYSIRTTYLFYLLTFVLIIYSTFLTRSGVLGDTSAHSFTQMGLEWQLVAFVGFFFLLGMFLYLFRRKGIPVKEKEESINSKEFWMLIGSIVLFFSAALIITSTSLPVYNLLYDYFIEPGYVGKVIQDPIEHYNKYQLWIAVLVGILSGTSQYMRFGARNWDSFKKKFFLHVGIAFVVSLIGSFLLYKQLNNANWQHHILIFSGLYAIITNLDYLITFLKGNLKAGASVISHLGFGILIFGVLWSGLNKSYITSDPFGQRGILMNEQLATNLQLFEESPYPVNSYWIEFKGDSLAGNMKYFDINFKRVDTENNVLEEFSLKPSAIYDTKFTKMEAFNPDTKHYWNKDIFTSITGYPLHLRYIDSLKVMEDTLNFKSYETVLNDTFQITRNVRTTQGTRTDTITGRFVSYTFEPEHENIDLDSVDLAVGAEVEFTHNRLEGTYRATPALVLRDGLVYQYPETIDPLRLRAGLDESVFSQIFTQEDKLDYTEFQMKQGGSILVDDINISLVGFDKEPRHPQYKPSESDIAIAAQLQVSKPGFPDVLSTPLYIIRDNKQFSIKDYIPELGIHLRFNKIDPATEVMSFAIAEEVRNLSSVNLRVAANVPRSDLIVIESIVFPGMNLVWLGTCMSLLGLLMSMFVRLKQKV
jgi:cytochrome c-type biogenesis protein CcmF